MNGQQVRHPALKAQDDMYAAAQQNMELAQQNEQLSMQGQQLAQEYQQMKAAMQDPNVDTNIGGLAPQQGQVSPTEALYDGVSKGISLDELAQAGVVDASLAEMTQQGVPQAQQQAVFEELMQLGAQQPAVSTGNKFSLS